jgi:hypothetical protein
MITRTVSREIMYIIPILQISLALFCCFVVRWSCHRERLTDSLARGRGLGEKKMANQSTIDSLIEAIEAAQNNWADCDWTHGLRDADGDVVRDAKDNEIVCDGDNTDCDYCRRASAAASAAGKHGDAAIAAITRGDLEDALTEVETASRIESEWGDDPAWGPVVRVIRGAVKAAKEEVDYLLVSEGDSIIVSGPPPVLRLGWGAPPEIIQEARDYSVSGDGCKVLVYIETGVDDADLSGSLGREYQGRFFVEVDEVEAEEATQDGE